MRIIRLQDFIKPIILLLVMFCVFSVSGKVAYATNDTMPIPDINISIGDETEKTPIEYVDNINY